MSDSLLSGGQASMRGRYLNGGLVAASLIAAAFAVSVWRTSAREYELAAQDLPQCAHMIREMHALANQPRIASLALESPQEILERVAEAQAAADMPPESLISVAPSVPTRIASSDYQQRSTSLVLQSLPLAKLATFIRALDANQDGMLVRDLSLTPADTDASVATELWNARLTLTQLIYSPKSD